MYTLEQLEQKNIKQLKEIGHQLNVLPDADRRCRQNWIDAIVGVNPRCCNCWKLPPAGQKVELAAKSIAPAAKTKKRVQSRSNWLWMKNCLLKKKLDRLFPNILFLLP
jgi:hypothetical protein